MTTLTRLVPWIAAVTPLIPLWGTIVGLIAGLVWIAVIAAFRVGGRGQDRRTRLSLDLILLACCVGGFFLGGLYFAPAAAVFWLLDRGAPEALATSGPTLRTRRHPPSLYLGLLTTALGIAGIAAFLVLPMYTAASSTLTAPGVNAITGANALQIGVGTLAVVAIALIGALFALVAIGALMPERRHRLRRMILGSAVLGLFCLTLFGGFTIGYLVVPGLLLAFVTWTVSLVEREGAEPGTQSAQ